MLKAWRYLAATAAAVALLAGCGGGSGDGDTPPVVTGTLVAATRAVPETVTVAGSPRLRVEGGDDYLLILSESSGSSGTAAVTVNGGGANLPLLSARRSADTRRHTPTASWDLGLGQLRRRQSDQSDPSVGSSREFAVFQGSQPTVTATLRAKGTHCLLYVDNSTVVGAFTEADLTDLQDQFDNQMYATNTSIYGPVSDVDGNGRMIVLFTPTITPGGYGYFYPGDLMGAGNNADILYARVPSPNNGQTYAVLRTGLLATLAHELAHLINYHHKEDLGGEESWLNEGLSFACEQLNGWLDSAGGSPENVAAYFRSPERYTLRELTGDYDDGHAGADYLLVRYLMDRFGQDIIGDLVTSNQIGQANVTASSGVAYTSLMTDAAAAWYLAGTDLTDDARWSLPGFDTMGTYPVLGVTLSGPRYTAVSAANSEPKFAASFARGGLRYLRLTNVPAAGAMFTLTTASGSQVRATFVRIPTSAP